ncbi:aminopeptidase [Pseudoxanthomonas wuyuanensis]|uniref:Glycyl aminopeptidase. Metallo peptidase. MEROPS family M61 n=1 Tax=Pseudoxanthomonas wuyuanensis TaxID=1073196 RepID=A0A286CZ04_9GAMM|nr:aminopeptidase [Pseudoxanthomonas wuyuanensis]KAF1722246.1 aminopeptidase [Pseudoxanthomonas wuyuanensis]SOD51630.1 glycyl aminopeptidase. Metallo peptidase. MEROPS family M61 [Pseudoxanthomonas wuyuanensis]
MASKKGLGVISSWLALILGAVAALGVPTSASCHSRQDLQQPDIAAPQDRRFDGTIRLEVDARDVVRRVFYVRETIPVQVPGKTTLLYPEWEASSHAPTISAASLTGLVAFAGSQRLEWQRDELEMHAFHVDVPEGVDDITVEFQYVVRAGEAFLRPDLVAVQWQRLLLYPAGWYARNIPIQAGVRLPSGLHTVSSLHAEETSDESVRFAATTLDALLDAPVIAARYIHSHDLGLPGQPAFRLSLLSDSEEAPDLQNRDVTDMRRMMRETHAVFGRAPYRRFQAMVILSDAFPPGGVEHADSAEIYLPADYFRDRSSQLNNLDLIVHEHVHAWNGRFRVPTGQWTPTPNTPIRNGMLWSYEGQTEFWGRVLAARSGLRSHQETLDKLALDAANVQAMNGRAWKTLRDTTNDPVYLSSRAAVWPEWQRRKDYYTEGVLLWLELDMMLREGSDDQYGLDDLAAAFYSADIGPGPHTYTFGDLCAALHRLLPIDWSKHLNERLDTHLPLVLGGLDRAGWELVYDDKPTSTFLQYEAEMGGYDVRHSLGMVVDTRGRVQSVMWDGPAYRAGIGPGAVLEAINGEAFSGEALLSAIEKSADNPIFFRMSIDAYRSDLEIDYDGGPRYPHLRRIGGRPDRLTQLLKSRSP